MTRRVAFMVLSFSAALTSAASLARAQDPATPPPASTVAAQPAAAPPGGPLAARAPLPLPPVDEHWDPAWSHAGPWDYALAGVGAAAVTFELAVLQPIRPPLRWDKPILFDSDVRSALRTTNANTANTLENVTWGLWGAQLAYPVFVDVPFALAHHRSQLAWDLAWQDAVTLTLAGAVDGGLRDLVGRARPTITDCLQAGGGNSCLSGSDSTRSFPGGHLVNSTAATALTCTQHFYMHLYGGPWDAVVCATSVASDLGIAVMRVVSDNHYATDQIAGLATGALIGWGVPYVMHLHGRSHPRDDGAAAPAVMVMPMPMTLDHGGGLGMTGIF